MGELTAWTTNSSFDDKVEGSKKSSMKDVTTVKIKMTSGSSEILWISCIDRITTHIFVKMGIINLLQTTKDARKWNGKQPIWLVNGHSSLMRETFLGVSSSLAVCDIHFIHHMLMFSMIIQESSLCLFPNLSVECIQPVSVLCTGVYFLCLKAVYFSTVYALHTVVPSISPLLCILRLKEYNLQYFLTPSSAEPPEFHVRGCC
jgi:hypothetical protein